MVNLNVLDLFLVLHFCPIYLFTSPCFGVWQSRIPSLYTANIGERAGKLADMKSNQKLYETQLVHIEI